MRLKLKITQEQNNYIYNDIYLMKYISKILQNEYFYWRNKDEFKAKKIINCVSSIDYCRKVIYKHRSDNVRAMIKEKENRENVTQLQLEV